MRVSKISRDTANLVAALASRRRSTRTSSAASSATLAPDLETSSEPTNPRKRKHTSIKVEEELVQTSTFEPKDAPVVQRKTRPKRARRQPAKKIKGEDGGVIFEPPPNWQEMWNITKKMREQWPAAVDTMGCESLADVKRSPRDQRFQTLVALMLSSQTKDTVTSVAIKNLQERLPGGFSVESICKVSPQVLNELINKVGFHNNKTKFIKQAADVICTSYNGDIPDTVEGLMSLPGVGPKMAYLCMSAAWDRHEGIGVDVHVHRITNLWGWHKTNTPEQTREQLEAWLPKDRWHAINHLLVGFGQTWCPPVGRKCADCALAQKSLCPSAVISTSSPRKAKKKAAKLEVLTDSKNISAHEVATQELTHIKSEDMETSISIPGIQDIEDIASWPRRTRSRGIKVER